MSCAHSMIDECLFNKKNASKDGEKENERGGERERERKREREKKNRALNERRTQRRNVSGRKYLADHVGFWPCCSIRDHLNAN